MHYGFLRHQQGINSGEAFHYQTQKLPRTQALFRIFKHGTQLYRTGVFVNARIDKVDFALFIISGSVAKFDQSKNFAGVVWIFDKSALYHIAQTQNLIFRGRKNNIYRIKLGNGGENAVFGYQTPLRLNFHTGHTANGGFDLGIIQI